MIDLLQRLMKRQQVHDFFFQRRVREDGSFIPRTRRAAIYQRLFESGLITPWNMTHQQCLDFWNIPAGQTGVTNRPEDYAEGPIAIMNYVADFIRPYVRPGDKLIEIGCNAGCKMNELLKRGYSNLSGLEVNRACFDVLRQYFPDLAAKSTLMVGSAESVLPTLPTGAYQLVYSISSLCVVHPTQHRAFAEMARVSSEYVLTLEIEWAGRPYMFPRNYRRIFEKLGFVQVASTLITRESCPEPELMSYWGQVMRLFRKTGTLSQASVS